MNKYILILLGVMLYFSGYGMQSGSPVLLTDSILFHRYDEIVAGNDSKLKKIQHEIDSLQGEIGGVGLIADMELYKTIGDLFFSICSFSESVLFYTKAYEIGEEIGFPLDPKRVNALGVIHKVQGYYDKAIAYHHIALKLSERLGDDRGILASQYYIGISKREMGKIKLSVELIFDVLKKAEEQGNVEFMALASNSIGHIYAYVDNPDMSLNYYSKSLCLFESINDSSRISIVRNNIGKTLTKFGE